MPSRTAYRYITCAAVAAEVARLRGAGAPTLPLGAWPEDMTLGDDGLGVDSLERLGIVAALAETFDLNAATLNAKQPERVGDLVDWVVYSAGDEGSITVMTSGSTGTPRPCTHVMADLVDEARYFASLLGSRRRIVTMVPGHHLYGVIWTALLPDILGVPTSAQRIGARLDLRSGDVLVLVPEQWRAIVRLYRRLPDDLWGVTSGGPLADTVGEGLLAGGISRMLDIYGSSETGGIGLRDVPEPEYQLLPRWRLSGDGCNWCLQDRRGRSVTLPDLVERTGERSLRPVGRRDGAVQIAGRNVWPQRVAAVLRSVAGVDDVAVRLAANGRLKAFVVPAAGVDPDQLARTLTRSAAELLSDEEKPKAFAFGAALPRNEMGKLMDWA
jgi:4-coumarate--CoA ligase (photoactive yellow protein activation family)